MTGHRKTCQKLFAVGFNAWNQLRFNPETSAGSDPEDKWEFECVLEDESIEVLTADMSSTLIRTSSKGLQIAGQQDSSSRFCVEQLHWKNHVAIAGNDKVAVLDRSRPTRINIYESVSSLPSSQKPDSYEFDCPILQLSAGTTTFTVLDAEGDVFTWGDPRYSACLGREVDDEDPANEPGMVTALQNLPTGPIRKIVSGGYTTAALTEGNDLYIWGCSSPSSTSDEGDFLLTPEPEPLDVADADVLDVGLGDHHIIILASVNEQRKVLVHGSNGNGQLGLGDGREQVRGWREAELHLGDGEEVVSVESGPRCSFVLVAKVEAVNIRMGR